MSLNELKKLLRRLGGMLVMDGDKPSFVMLSYENYSQMEREAEADIVVNHDAGLEYHRGLAAAGNDGDEELIKQLNEEVAMLRQEIKLKEMEEMLPTEPAAE